MRKRLASGAADGRRAAYTLARARKTRFGLLAARRTSSEITSSLILSWPAYLSPGGTYPARQRSGLQQDCLQRVKRQQGARAVWHAALVRRLAVLSGLLGRGVVHGLPCCAARTRRDGARARVSATRRDWPGPRHTRRHGAPTAGVRQPTRRERLRRVATRPRALDSTPPSAWMTGL